MPKPDKNKIPNAKPRKSVYLSQIVSRDIEDILPKFENAHKIEIIEHLLAMLGEISEYFDTRDGAIYDRYRVRESSLLKKYGKAFKPYDSKQFYKLFDFTTVLVEKGYYTDEEFNALQDQENDLSKLDIGQFTWSIRNFLQNELHYYYLEKEPEFETTKPQELNGAKEEPDNEMTEARRLLAIYFILKEGFNVEQKVTHSATAIARLCHLLLGKPFTTAQNSSIYSKYKKMPEYNSGSVLVKDLRYIRHYFEELDMKNVLELIDKQIKSASKKDL